MHVGKETERHTFLQNCGTSLRRRSTTHNQLHWNDTDTDTDRSVDVTRHSQGEEAPGIPPLHLRSSPSTGMDKISQRP